jgi:hypothetical protein
MPIQIEWENREARPRCFCDRCGEAIADVADGLALWEERDVTAIGRRELFLIHRACLDDFRHYRMSCTVGDWLQQDLGWFLASLGRGIGFGADEQAASAERRVSI